jgi:hypothetical protein
MNNMTVGCPHNEWKTWEGKTTGDKEEKMRSSKLTCMRMMSLGLFFKKIMVWKERHIEYAFYFCNLVATALMLSPKLTRIHINKLSHTSKYTLGVRSWHWQQNTIENKHLFVCRIVHPLLYSPFNYAIYICSCIHSMFVQYEKFLCGDNHLARFLAQMNF